MRLATTLLALALPVMAQRSQAPGRSLGSVTTRGDLILVTLDENALGKANLFDLAGRTLTFTPETGGYRLENQPLRWDPDFGAEIRSAESEIQNFAFPFSGKEWKSLSVGLTGNLRFGPPRAQESAGVSIGRFDQLRAAARSLVNTVPAICVFFKPRMNGTRYLKQLSDRVLVTWTLSEPAGNIQDFTWTPTVNRFQTVLHRDGRVEMSYEQLAARDAIVGLYPVTGAAAEPVDLSAAKGVIAVPYEAFHYLALPNARDLSCTVIKALGDKFDFLAYYSDFRIDNQEAGTPSTGPVGGGVTGIGQNQRNGAPFCSEGRFQWSFIQPVYAGSNQMQEYPPPGIPDTNSRNIAFYAKQLGERSSDGRMLPYNYGIAQIAHEMGHRWSAFVSANVNGETIRLGPTHWTRGLHAPVAFPYQRPTEASAMGGSVWQDNFDGTFTQLDDDYYVPATGWSYLELYLMGLIAPEEVPDFFLLRNLTPAGRDAQNRPIVKAERLKVTVQDVIAARRRAIPRRPPLPAQVQHRDRRDGRERPDADSRAARSRRRDRERVG